MTVAELRSEARRRSISTGLWIAGASKAALVEALETGAAPEAAANSNANSDLASVIAAAVQSHLNITPELDVDEVRRIAREEAQAAQAGAVRPVEVRVPGKAPVLVGVQHAQFDTLLQMIGADVPVYMVGPAGSGKTYSAESAALALSLPYYCQSVCQQTTASYLIGYMDANGRYVSSLFRQAFEGGGVYLLDEIDAGNPNVLCMLNAAISNGICAFPDGMIKRHGDFRLIAAANTYGTGANRKYVGRNQLDAASLDRYAYLDWQYDEALETAICPNRQWGAFVQAVRHAAAELELQVVISPRASLNGAKLLAAGMDAEAVAKAVVFKGMDSDTARKLQARVQESGVRYAA